MNEFIWRKNNIHEIPRFLLSTVVGFRESQAYGKLREYERDIPGVVLGAFAEYLCRIHESNLTEQKEASAVSAITSAHQAIEVLASSPESAIRELVTDEIYENLECNAEALERIKQHLKPAALALYR